MTPTTRGDPEQGSSPPDPGDSRLDGAAARVKRPLGVWAGFGMVISFILGALFAWGVSLVSRWSDGGIDRPWLAYGLIAALLAGPSIVVGIRRPGAAYFMVAVHAVAAAAVGDPRAMAVYFAPALLWTLAANDWSKPHPRKPTDRG